jgi:hypothetical protein
MRYATTGSRRARMKRPATTILATLLTAVIFRAGDAAELVKPEPRPTGIFQVNVTQGFLWLNAEQAPLAQVLREIGRQGGIDVETNIGPEQTITARLDRVPLEDGIRQLATNVSVFYAQGGNAQNQRIAKIVVLSEGSGVASRPNVAPEPPSRKPVPDASKADKPQPQPFKFQLDPGNAGTNTEPPSVTP